MLSANEEKKLNDDAKNRQIYDLRVFVVGGGFQYTKMFFDAGFKGARNTEEADIICFTGGEDVTPDFYGQKPITETYFNEARDRTEAYIYGEALALKKPMVGICRGGQFLNVMNEGQMWQDVNNHAIRGGHNITDVRTGEILRNMTSTHHQMMRPGKSAKVIATASLSTMRKDDRETHEKDQNDPFVDDTEVVWYQDSLVLCFQPHPEFGHGECRNYFLDLVDEYILPAC